MAPAKNIGAARILVIVMVATALLPSSSATVTKSDENLFKFALAGLISSVLDDVIAATPPAKIPEVKAAGEKQVQLASAKVNTAKGDKAKLDAFMLAYKKVDYFPVYALAMYMVYVTTIGGLTVVQHEAGC
uniref:Uncharacterized protein n=1 Tax=Aegilops tauschii TaxID=37682 RepID=M8CKP2_AEGTA